jgi:DNA-binding NarL/FixJ family response regulator
MQAASAVDVTDLLRGVAAPTLVLHRRGMTQIPVDVPRSLADDLPPPMPAPRPAAVTPLSPREVEVLRLLAAGESNRQIAHHLGLSPHTVERHVANLYRKIGARGGRCTARWTYGRRHWS